MKSELSALISIGTLRSEVLALARPADSNRAKKIELEMARYIASFDVGEQADLVGFHVGAQAGGVQYRVGAGDGHGVIAPSLVLVRQYQQAFGLEMRAFAFVGLRTEHIDLRDQWHFIRFRADP